MQEITESELKALISEAKKANKDVTDLENDLKTIKAKSAMQEGEIKVLKETKDGTVYIESTGPAREEDFE